MTCGNLYRIWTMLFLSQLHMVSFNNSKEKNSQKIVLVFCLSFVWVFWFAFCRPLTKIFVWIVRFKAVVGSALERSRQARHKRIWSVATFISNWRWNSWEKKKTITDRLNGNTYFDEYNAGKTLWDRWTRWCTLRNREFDALRISLVSSSKFCAMKSGREKKSSHHPKFGKNVITWSHYKHSNGLQWKRLGFNVNK